MRRTCGICGRVGDKREVTFHHYYPRPYRSSVPKNHRADGIYLCDDRHTWLHRNYSPSELGEYYSSWESLYNLFNDCKL